MRNGVFALLTVMSAGSGLVLAQPPASLPPPIFSLPVFGPVSQRPTLPATFMQAPPAQTEISAPAPNPAAAPAPMPADGHGPAPHCAQPCWDDPPFLYAGRVWVTSDYLLWWGKAQHLPALVTTGNPGTLTTSGALGQPGTVVLIGEGDQDDEVRSGARFSAGFWFNPEQTVGVEAGFFFLEPAGSGSSVSAPTGASVLARPYINSDLVNVGIAGGLTVDPENALLVAYPGQFAGNALATTRNEVWGVEGNGRINVLGNGRYRADALFGFRYLEVKDALAIANSSQTLPGDVGNFVTFGGSGLFGPTPVFSPASATVLDTFRTRNDFYGGQLGAHISLLRGPFSADLRGKLALGCVHQTVDIAGLSTLTSSGTTRTAPGGLLALSSNSGHYERNEFGIVPEANLTFGYQATRHVKALVGYSVIYWRSDVVRPDSIIDRTVNPSLVPLLTNGLASPDQRPAFSFRDTDFWVQGLTFGVEVSF